MDTYDLYVVRETDRAILVKENQDDDDADAFWLPKSQLEGADDAATGTISTLGIPDWLAQEKGLA